MLLVVCLFITDGRSPVPEQSSAADSPASDSSDDNLFTLDSHQVYDCSAGQLMTVVSAAAASSQSQ